MNYSSTSEESPVASVSNCKMAESFSETLAISTRRARGHFLWLAEKKQLKRRAADKSCHGRLLLGRISNFASADDLLSSVYPLLVPVEHQAECGMIKLSEMVIQPFKLIDRQIIGKIVGYLDPPSAVCLALTCKRLKASVYNTCGTSKLKEICPRDVRSKMTTSLRPYNIFTGMLQSGAYNIDNLKLCPEVSEPDDVIPLAIVREVAWAQDASVELGPQGSIPPLGPIAAATGLRLIDNKAKISSSVWNGMS
jgi:hypothetical protein